MTLILILGVCFAFLSAIFTGGYEDKPGQSIRYNWPKKINK